MIINTEAGLRSTDKQLIEAARCFGCSRLQLFWKISLPSAVPFLFAGMKLAIGRGLVAVVVAELFGSRAGLGFLLAQASDAFNMPLSVRLGCSARGDGDGIDMARRCDGENSDAVAVFVENQETHERKVQKFRKCTRRLATFKFYET